MKIILFTIHKEEKNIKHLHSYLVKLLEKYCVSEPEMEETLIYKHCNY